MQIYHIIASCTSIISCPRAIPTLKYWIPWVCVGILHSSPPRATSRTFALSCTGSKRRNCTLGLVYPAQSRQIPRVQRSSLGVQKLWVTVAPDLSTLNPRCTVSSIVQLSFLKPLFAGFKSAIHEVQQFGSIPHLLQLTASADLLEISREMRAHSAKLRKEAALFWNSMLHRFEALQGSEVLLLATLGNKE